MPEFEIVIPIQSSQYGDCIILSKYGDNYQLLGGRTVQKGELAGRVFKLWVYPQIGKKGDNKPAEKAIPLQIPLGSLNEARAVLTQLLDEMPGGKPLVANTGDNDIPF
jgi:hypothetical protein